MFTEDRKLSLIEAIIKSKNNVLLDGIERMLNDEPQLIGKPEKSGFGSLVGVLTADEADAMKRTIEDNFENVRPDDWK